MFQHLTNWYVKKHGKVPRMLIFDDQAKRVMRCVDEDAKCDGIVTNKDQTHINFNAKKIKEYMSLPTKFSKKSI